MSAKLETIGSEHDFTVRCGGVVVAGVWHSDLGEWTVATPDGPVYREESRAAAMQRVEALARQTAERH